MEYTHIFLYTDFEDMIMDPTFWIMMFVLLIVAVLILRIVLGAAIKSQERSDAAQPIKTSRAKVIDKQPISPDAGMFASSLVIWFLFELESGERVRLRAKAFCGLVVGDTGTLTWQGERVRNFEWDEKKNSGEEF